MAAGVDVRAGAGSPTNCWGDAMRDYLTFRDVVSDQSPNLLLQGFTERQARFLATVMTHSGVFVERQYCRFAGVAHGQKSHDFIQRLVGAGFAREERPGRLHQGRLFHVHHKRLYTLIGQADNRHRRRAPRSRMIERLMLLDAVLDDRDLLWLGTESDKARYFLQRLAEYRLEPRELPHLAFGSEARQTLRLFPDKLPIGIDPIGDRYVFTYLVTRASPTDFRAFLVRHFQLLRMLRQWTVRVLVPRPFATAIPAYRHALHEQVRRPMGLSDGKELEWLFEQRKREEQEPGFTLDARALEAAEQYRGSRFDALEKAWRVHGNDAVATVYSSGVADQFERGQASVEFVVMTRQYLHLAHLVGVA